MTEVTTKNQQLNFLGVRLTEVDLLTLFTKIVESGKQGLGTSVGSQQEMDNE
jgi:hypothetical protein